MPLFYYALLIIAACSAVFIPAFLLLRELDRTERHTPSVTPGRLSLSYTDIKIETPEGKLTGWYIPVEKDHAPAIIMLHGWAGNAASLLSFAQLFHENGFNVLLPNASGHGDSDVLGRSDMLRFSRDLEASFNWLDARDNVDMGRVMLMGHSIAGAAALLAGTRRRDLAGIITFGVFANSRPLIKRWIQHRTRFPFWPFGWLVILFKQLQLGLNYDQIAPENTIAAQSAPVLMIHGEKDDVVPVQQAHRIAANGGEQVTLLVDSSGGHATFLRTSKRLREQMQAFIASCL